MRHAHSTPKTRTTATVRGMTVAAVALIAAGSMILAFEHTAAAATPTYSGAATIADGSSDATELSGGSASLFTFNLPAQAACPGDTTTGGYLVDTYLVPEATIVSSLSFSGGFPSVGYALYDSSNNKAWAAENTATGTGQIISIPNSFEFGAQVGHSKPTLTNLLANSGVWEAGIACELNGALTDYWNTEVTFTTSSSDPGGFTWTQVPGDQTTPTTTTTTTTTTTEPSTTTTTTTEPSTTTTTTTEPSTTTTEPSTTTTTTDPSTTTTTTDPSTTTTTTEPATTTTTSSTTTTDPSTTTTTTDPSTTTTTAATGSTTTTTTGATSSTTTTTLVGVSSSASGGTGTGSTGTGSTAGSGSTGTGSSTGSGSTGSLAFTGFPVGKGIGLGLLAVGIGLVLLSWEPRVRARLLTTHRDGPR